MNLFDYINEQTVRFDVEVSGTEPIECGFAAGDYMVNATVLEKANGTAVISLITAEEKDPWTKVSSAAEAAKEGKGG